MTTMEHFAVLRFATGRVYCTLVPRPFRRPLLFLPQELGIIGILIAFGMTLEYRLVRGIFG